MKNGSNHSPETLARMGELQETLDGTDPFLLEAIQHKSLDDLQVMMNQLERELMVVRSSGNAEWIHRHQAIIQTLKDMHELRTLREYGSSDMGYSVG